MIRCKFTTESGKQCQNDKEYECCNIRLLFAVKKSAKCNYETTK